MRCHRFILTIGLLLPPALHAATFTVTSAADSGNNTLRWAITQANATPAADTIAFNIGGGGARNIALASALPAITAPLTIDGGTQPGYSNAPLIQLDGRAAGAGIDGLHLASSTSVLRALSIIGFGASGVLIDGVGGNTVTLCHIGLNGGGGALGNGHTGVYIRSSPNNLIGPGNVISANAVDGVRIDLAAATGNAVFGNRIGTDINGSAAIANGFNGVVITAASNNRIGGSTPTDLNIISGNTKNGVGIAAGASGNLVARNYIGLAADGAAALGNGEDGVLIVDSPTNKVGGDVTGTFNIIAANGAHGVELRGDGANGNIIQRNIIGSDLFGTLDRGNLRAGVYLTPTAGGNGGSDNQIGSAAFGAGGNLISGNGWAGIHIVDANSTLVRGNRIGSDYAGTSALPNSGGGIDIVNAWGTLIGSADAGNLISGNAGTGIDVQFEGQLSILGNRIGSSADGMAALPNQGRGIWVRDAWNGAVIGGSDHDAWTCNRDCNLIVAHPAYGIELGSTQTGAHKVQGNFIGIRVDGVAALANTIGISSNVWAEVGGSASGAGNLISGNTGHGILAADGMLVALGNRIGSNASGTAAVANTQDGIHAGSGRVHLEVGDVGAGNLISGNGDDGVEINQVVASSFPTQILRGNSIGTTPTGACLGNAGHGVYFAHTAFTEIGGIAAGQGNRIACNGADGFADDGNAHANGMMGNSFYGNGGLAIDLDDDGVTANDPGDTDVWRDNFPVIATAVQSGASAQVLGTLDATPSASFRVEFFSDSVCDASGHGEGRTFVGAIAVSTDANGHAGFSTALPGLSVGQKLTATSTIIIGSAPFIDYNTSEFSACISVVAPTSAPTAGNNGPICARQTLNLTASTVAGASYAWTGPNGFSSTQQNPSIGNASAAASGSYSVIATVAGVSSPAASTSATVRDCQISIADPAPITEGSSGTTPVTFTVNLSNSSTQAMTIAWQTVDGSATAPADYGAGSGTLTIPANATSASITRNVVGDSLDEDAENFHIDLSAPSAGSLSDSRGTLTINDDDAAPTLSVDAGGCSVLEGNAGTTACTATVRLSAPSGKTISFSVQTADGSAQAVSDYQALGAGVRTIAAGATTLAVPVQVIGDTLVEPDETFEMRLSAVQNASPSALTGIGTIRNDDVATTAGNNGPICARQTLNLTASTVAGGSYAWTGPNGYTSTQQNPSIGSAGVAASGSYSVIATVAGVSSPAASTSATVRDCQISIADPAAINEGSGGSTAATFTVSLSASSTQAMTVAWQTVDGSASAPADYSAGSGTLTIPANATSANLSVSVVGDTLDEDAENFHIDLSAPSAGSLSDSRGTLTINDDDAAPTLSVDAGGCTVFEGNSGTTPCTTTVRLSAASGKAVSFSVQTANSTAQAVSDYQALGASVRTINAGATSLALPVQVIGDTLIEPDEAFEVRLTAVQNASPATLTGIAVILNDDNAALIFANGFE